MTLSTRWGVTDALAVVIVLGEWSGITRAAIGAPVYAGALDVALVVMMGYVMFRWWRSDRYLPRSLAIPTALLAAYFVYAAIEILNPNVPGLIVGLEGFRKTAFTMLAFGVVAFSPAGNPRRFLAIVALGSLAAFLWGIRQFIAPLPLEQQIIETSGVSPITFHAGQVMRAFAPTSGPFHFGILGASVMVIAIVLSRSGSTWWFLPAIVAAIALGLSLTRANMIAGAVGLAVSVAIHGTMRERTRAGLGAAASLVAVALASLVASGFLAFSPAGPVGSAPEATAAPISTSQPSSQAATAQPTVVPATAEAAPEGNLFDPKNLRLRFGYWLDFVQAIWERPVFGYGTSSAADGMSADYQGTGSIRFEPHSMYLKAALELGVPGLLVFLAIMVWAVVASVRALRTHWLIAASALGIGATVAVSGITGPMLDAYPFNLLLWAVLGWVAVARTEDSRRSVSAAGAIER